jgi:hypothetical protein
VAIKTTVTYHCNIMPRILVSIAVLTLFLTSLSFVRVLVKQRAGKNYT